jgi:hypothetical protein
MVVNPRYYKVINPNLEDQKYLFFFNTIKKRINIVRITNIFNIDDIKNIVQAKFKENLWWLTLDIIRRLLTLILKIKSISLFHYY